MSTKRQIRNWSLFSSLPPPVFILVFRPFLWKKSPIKIRGAWKLGRVTLLRKHSGRRMDEKKEREGEMFEGGRGEKRRSDDRWLWCTRALLAWQCTNSRCRAFENASRERVLSPFVIHCSNARVASSWPRFSSIFGTVNACHVVVENEGSRSVVLVRIGSQFVFSPRSRVGDGMGFSKKMGTRGG